MFIPYSLFFIGKKGQNPDGGLEKFTYRTTKYRYLYICKPQYTEIILNKKSKENGIFGRLKVWIGIFTGKIYQWNRSAPSIQTYSLPRYSRQHSWNHWRTMR